MNSIIRDFYEGNLCPSNQIGPPLRRFRKEWAQAFQYIDNQTLDFIVAVIAKLGPLHFRPERKLIVVSPASQHK